MAMQRDGWHEGMCNHIASSTWALLVKAICPGTHFFWDKNDNSAAVCQDQIWRHLQYIVASTHVNLFFATGRPRLIWFLSHHIESAAQYIPSALCLGWLQQTVSSSFTDSSATRKNTVEIRYQSLKRTSWLFVRVLKPVDGQTSTMQRWNQRRK